MALVITKKVRTILLIVLAVLVVVGGGFLIWRVTQEESVAPGDSEASCPDSCMYLAPTGDWFCINGEMTKTFSSDCYESYQITVDGTQRNCWRDCRTTTPGDEVDCDDYQDAPSVNNCPDSTYDYRCGTRCYTTENGPECCGNEGLPDYCVIEKPDSYNTTFTSSSIPQKAEIILYYQKLESYDGQPKFIFEDADGQSYTVRTSSSSQRLATGVIADPGDKIKITAVWDSDSEKALGWLPVNSDGTCGTGAMGPPTDNNCKPYETPSITAYRKPDPNGDENLLSRQCWADNMEWDGDYDFNDYFVQLYYLPIIEEEAEPFCGDGAKNGDEVCDPTDSNNDTCVNNLGDTVACNDDCTCPVAIQTNPDWTIVKDVVGEYIVVNDENFARADYTITVTNVGDGDGSIDKIVDELDSKVLESYIQEISNDGVFASGSITWDLQGDDEIFSPQESLELTYSLQIPESAYGTYRNLVTAYPREGDDFSDDATIVFEADEEQPPTVPQTGVFDTVLGRVSVGVSFIFLGGLVSQYSKINYLLNSISQKQEFRSEIRKQRKAKRRRERLEDRFKND